MLNREMLENRKAELQTLVQQNQALIAQHTANLNACMGAIQDCDHWLALLDAADEKAAAKAQGDVEAAKLN